MVFDASPEVAPMSGIDEYLIHNFPQPQRVMYTSDPRAYERTWFTCQDKTGDLLVVTGIGFYPNLDTADAYGIVCYKGQHTHVRYHRRLGANRMDMRMGPLNFEVLEPFKTWRLSLGENPYGVTYEILWHDTKRPIFAPMVLGTTPRNTSGVTPTDSVGYEGFGAMEGWVELNGQRFNLSPATYNGSRDHHWGARAGVGAAQSLPAGQSQQGSPPPPVTHAGQWVEFRDWSIWGIRNFRPWGDPQPGAGSYTIPDRRFRFDPETGEFVEAVITDVTESGEKKELHLRRLGFQSAYLRFGGYGSTPDGNLAHGVYPGEDTLFGGTTDMTKAEYRRSTAGLVDHHCEVTCGSEKTVGVFECVEPRLQEACRRGVAGFRFL